MITLCREEFGGKSLLTQCSAQKLRARSGTQSTLALHCAESGEWKTTAEMAQQRVYV